MKKILVLVILLAVVAVGIFAFLKYRRAASVDFSASLAELEKDFVNFEGRALDLEMYRAVEMFNEMEHESKSTALLFVGSEFVEKYVPNLDANKSVSSSRDQYGYNIEIVLTVAGKKTEYGVHVFQRPDGTYEVKGCGEPFVGLMCEEGIHPAAFLIKRLGNPQLNAKLTKKAVDLFTEYPGLLHLQASVKKYLKDRIPNLGSIKCVFQLIRGKLFSRISSKMVSAKISIGTTGRMTSGNIWLVPSVIHAGKTHKL